MKFSYSSGSKPLDGYTIKRGIGIGGFGEVYFALSEAGKEVALKKIQRNLDVELRGVRQCLNLKHVNLITLWDIRTNEHGESWVVMEYVPGPSLRDVIEANPNGMPDANLKTWFVSTASGCAYLHEKGIVHRDLKPGNIFCDDDEQVIKIGDYGLSKFISCSRRSGQTESVGTFHYMAPEIGKGVYGKEIDIYALGIILFEMLTGDVPFDGESTQEIIMKHLTTDPDVDCVPSGFRDVIRKAMRKDPELRYSSVPEMLVDMPWPEIAANSQNIVSQHSIGRLSAKPPPDDMHVVVQKSTHHHASSDAKKSAAEKIAQQGSQLPAAIIDSNDIHVVQPEIVFGKLRDSSVGGNKNGNAHSNRSADRGKNHEDPVRIIDPQQRAGATSSRGLTVPPTPDEVVVARQMVTDQAGEPIARAVQTGFGGITNWWTNGDVSTPVKLAVLIVSSVVIIKNSQWLLPLAIGLGTAYVLYFAGRSWWAKRTESKILEGMQPAGKSSSDSLPVQLSQREQRQQQTNILREWIGSHPTTDRATELLGSLLVSAFACLVLNLLGLAIGGSVFDPTIHSWAVYAWLTTTSVAACWGVLILSKIWEQHDVGSLVTKESLGRRAILVLFGLAVGTIAFFTAGTFSIDLSDKALLGIGASETNLAVGGIPLLPAYLVFFALLFAIIRWWKQADPIRSTRLSVASVILCLVWATVFSHLFQVAAVPNCILAVVVSVSVQLASPWLPPEQRQQIYQIPSAIR